MSRGEAKRSRTGAEVRHELERQGIIVRCPSSGELAEEAAHRGWKYEKVAGDMSLFVRLVNGEWDDKDFLVVPPGWRVVARHNEQILGAEQV